MEKVSQKMYICVPCDPCTLALSNSNRFPRDQCIRGVGIIQSKADERGQIPQVAIFLPSAITGTNYRVKIIGYDLFRQMLNSKHEWYFNEVVIQCLFNKAEWEDQNALLAQEEDATPAEKMASKFRRLVEGVKKSLGQLKGTAHPEEEIQDARDKKFTSFVYAILALIATEITTGSYPLTTKFIDSAHALLEPDQRWEYQSWGEDLDEQPPDDVKIILRLLVGMKEGNPASASDHKTVIEAQAHAMTLLCAASYGIDAISGKLINILLMERLTQVCLKDLKKRITYAGLLLFLAQTGEQENPTVTGWLRGEHSPFLEGEAAAHDWFSAEYDRRKGLFMASQREGMETRAIQIARAMADSISLGHILLDSDEPSYDHELGEDDYDYGDNSLLLHDEDDYSNNGNAEPSSEAVQTQHRAIAEGTRPEKGPRFGVARQKGDRQDGQIGAVVRLHIYTYIFGDLSSEPTLARIPIAKSDLEIGLIEPAIRIYEKAPAGNITFAYNELMGQVTFDNEKSFMEVLKTRANLRNPVKSNASEMGIRDIKFGDAHLEMSIEIFLLQKGYRNLRLFTAANKKLHSPEHGTIIALNKQKLIEEIATALTVAAKRYAERFPKVVDLTQDDDPLVPGTAAARISGHALREEPNSPQGNRDNRGESPRESSVQPPERTPNRAPLLTKRKPSSEGNSSGEEGDAYESLTRGS